MMVEVADLGLNGEPGRFVDEAIARDAQVICISAMMMHTARGANGCRRVRQILRERALEGRIKIAVGGAPFRFDPELYRIVEADSGMAALRCLMGQDFAVILLDVRMPLMDGFETARRIRQQRWGQSVVLVAVTGWGLPEDRRRTQAAGFNAHLVKPVNDDELLGVLDNLLARPSA